MPKCQYVKDCKYKFYMFIAPNVQNAPPCGLQNATTGAQFSPKRPQMRGPPNYLGRLGGDLGATSGPKQPKFTFS